MDLGNGGCGYSMAAVVNGRNSRTEVRGTLSLCDRIEYFKNLEKMSDKIKEALNPLEKLKEIILKYLKDEDVKVVLFGSRARGEFVNTSDVDIGIIVGKGADRKKLILLREYIDELNIPYKVEIVDFSTVSEEFKHMVLKEAVVWKD